MLAYPFLRRAIVVGALVSVSGALLGTILVPKKFTMVGNTLSSVGYGSMAVARSFGLSSLGFTMPVLMILSFFLFSLSDKSRLKADQALGIVSVSALAIGTATISHATGFNTDVCNYMFGSILAMEHSDVKISIVLSVLIIVLFVLYFNEIFAISFDEDFAKGLGLNTRRFKLMAATLTAVVISLGIKMMGALLISSLIIFPSITAGQISHKYKTTCILAVVISLICFVLGISLSYMYGLPTGASIVIVNLAVFVLMWLVARLKEVRI